MDTCGRITYFEDIGNCKENEPWLLQTICIVTNEKKKLCLETHNALRVQKKKTFNRHSNCKSIHIPTPTKRVISNQPSRPSREEKKSLNNMFVQSMIHRVVFQRLGSPQQKLVSFIFFSSHRPKVSPLYSCWKSDQMITHFLWLRLVGATGINTALRGIRTIVRGPYRIASSKTFFSPFWVNAEHSR